jgi:hypothetical protein
MVHDCVGHSQWKLGMAMMPLNCGISSSKQSMCRCEAMHQNEANINCHLLQYLITDSWFSVLRIHGKLVKSRCEVNSSTSILSHYPIFCAFDSGYGVVSTMTNNFFHIIQAKQILSVVMEYLLEYTTGSLNFGICATGLLLVCSLIVTFPFTCVLLLEASLLDAYEYTTHRGQLLLRAPSMLHNGLCLTNHNE